MELELTWMKMDDEEQGGALRVIAVNEIRAAWTFLELAALAGSMEVAISLPIPAWTMAKEGCAYGEYGDEYDIGCGFGDGDGYGYGWSRGNGEGYGEGVEGGDNKGYGFGYGYGEGYGEGLHCGDGFGVPTNR